MAKFSIDDLREAAEAKYGSMDIEIGEGRVVSLLNPMRMPEKARKEMVALIDAESGDSVEDELVRIKRVLEVVASSPADAKALLKAIGDDLAVLVEVLTAYMQGTQAGEA